MNTLFFDIETRAHPDVENWLEKDEVEFIPPDLDDVKAPSNWKDEAKIKDYIEGKKKEIVVRAEADYLDRVAKAETDFQDKIVKAPLDADLGRIVSIGTRINVDGDIIVRYVPEEWPVPSTSRYSPIELENDPGRSVVRVKDGVFGNDAIKWPFIKLAYQTEQELIQDFWKSLNEVHNNSCGYGILGFDLPYLLRRSFDYGIKPLGFIDLRRYQVRPFKDLMPILYNWTFKARPMKWVASRYGIDNPNEDMSGDMVADMDEPTMLRYTAGDIHIITELYKKADGVYWPSEIGA